MTTLELLKSAREILEDHYIPMVRYDGRGGYCALGAIEKASGQAVMVEESSHGPVPEATRLLGQVGLPAYLKIPERGKKIENGYYPLWRHQQGPLSLFDAASVVATVNNIAGKKAILQVFDDAISALEVSQLCQQVEKTEHPELDVEEVVA
jgi:hypothetical protein